MIATNNVLEVATVATNNVLEFATVGTNNVFRKGIENNPTLLLLFGNLPIPKYLSVFNEQKR